MTDVAALSDCICLDTTLLSGLSECIQTSCAYNEQLVASSAANSLCAAYPKESRSRDVQTASVVTLALVIPVVLARCAARWQVMKKLCLDDWTALLGMVLLAALAAMEYVSARMGFGNHYWNVKPSDGPVLLQIFYAAQILYILIQLSAKVSIALLFIRLFPARWIHRTLKIFIAFMVGHGLIFVSVIIFQCWPIYSIWDKSVTGSKCVDVTAVAYVGAALSIAEDIFLVLLPITELRKLQVTQRQRVLLSFMFAIGSFAAVTSMIRLKYMVMFANTFDSTSVFLGSLPPLRPWIIRLVPRVSVSWTKTRTKKSESGLPQSGHDGSTDKDAEAKPSRPEIAAIDNESLPLSIYGCDKKSPSYAMSTISSMRASDCWKMAPDSPGLLPTSSGQSNPTLESNSLKKSTSLEFNQRVSEDLESNPARDTWTSLGRETWSQSAAERLSSKFTGPRAG
ncbi:hypothetical protein LQW54_008121 [Pestalotiopsis sp. IQ-011]